jgi:hypothetical protein
MARLVGDALARADLAEIADMHERLAKRLEARQE